MTANVRAFVRLHRLQAQRPGDVEVVTRAEGIEKGKERRAGDTACAMTDSGFVFPDPLTDSGYLTLTLAFECVCGQLFASLLVSQGGQSSEGRIKVRSGGGEGDAQDGNANCELPCELRIPMLPKSQLPRFRDANAYGVRYSTYVYIQCSGLDNYWRKKSMAGHRCPCHIQSMSLIVM